jgi:hypothetical protein
VKHHFEERTKLADRLQENHAAVLALCSETIRRNAGYKRDAVTDALIQQSIVEFKERKKVVEELKHSAMHTRDVAIERIQGLAAAVRSSAG